MASHIVRALRNMNRENRAEEAVPLAQPNFGPYPRTDRWENLPEGATSNAEVISITESGGEHTRNLSYVYGIGTLGDHLPDTGHNSFPVLHPGPAPERIGRQVDDSHYPRHITSSPRLRRPGSAGQSWSCRQL